MAAPSGALLVAQRGFFLWGWRRLCCCCSCGSFAGSAAVRRRAAVVLLLLQLFCCRCCFVWSRAAAVRPAAAAATLSPALRPATNCSRRSSHSSNSTGQSCCAPLRQQLLTPLARVISLPTTAAAAEEALHRGNAFRGAAASLPSSVGSASRCSPPPPVTAAPALRRLSLSRRGSLSADFHPPAVPAAAAPTAAAPAAFLKALPLSRATSRCSSRTGYARRCRRDACLCAAAPSLCGRATAAGDASSVGLLLGTARAAASSPVAAAARVSLPASAALGASSSVVASSTSAASAAPSSAAEDDEFCDFTAQRVALFPGQGAQCLGMGIEAARSSAAARELFATASEVVGRDLLLLCSEGPEAELHQTAWAQPALLTASMAAVTRWREQQQQQAEKQGVSSSSSEPTACVGLSLGEYTALCFAGSLSFADAVKLTRLRGLSMQRAAEKHGGGMAAVLGLPREALEQLCSIVREDVDADNALSSSSSSSATGGGAAAAEEVGAAEQEQQQPSGKEGSRQDSSRQLKKCVLVVANYLCPGNYTVSGEKEALGRLEDLALRGRRRAPGLSAAAGGQGEAAAVAGEKGGRPLLLHQRAKRFLPLRVSGAFHSALMGDAAAALQEALRSTPLQRPKIPVLFNVDARTHSAPSVIKEKLMLQLTSPVLMEESLRTLLGRGMQEGLEFGPGNVLSNLIKKIQPEGVDLRQIP